MQVDGDVMQLDADVLLEQTAEHLVAPDLEPIEPQPDDVQVPARLRPFLLAGNDDLLGMAEGFVVPGRDLLAPLHEQIQLVELA